MSRVYICNLSSNAKERDIENLFTDFGQIRAVTIKNGLGLVDFDDSRDAKDAVYELNGREFCGKKAVVRIAENSKPIKRKVKEQENEKNEEKNKNLLEEAEEDSDDSKENDKFVCPNCSRMFPTKWNMKRHMGNIHNVIIFKNPKIKKNASKLEKEGNLEDSEKDSKQEGTSNIKPNGKKKAKKGKKRGNSVGLDKKNVTKKQKLEEPPRARSSSGSNTSNDGKTTNSFSSKDTTPLRSNSIDGKDNNKADAAAVPEEKHLVENNENKVLTKKHSKLNVQDISLITSVHPSGIEGILDLVADIVMKDGSTKSVASETLKKEAPRMLIDYYERALELKD